MKQAFGLVRRPWGVFYLKNKITGEQTSLKTSDKCEAQRILQAHNESECQPHFNLSLAQVYLNGADPKLATRTWQDVMEDIVAKKKDETRHRWETAIKDKNFDCLRNLPVGGNPPEHFDRALADGKVSTNVYFGGSTITPLAWNGCSNQSFRACNGPSRCSSPNGPSRRKNTRPSSCGSKTRAPGLLRTAVAHRRGAIGRGLPAGGRHQLAGTHDLLYAQEIERRAGLSIKPTLFRFSAEIEGLLKRRPAAGPLFPYLCTVRAGDRATEFKQRCDGLGISGVSLHSYRYAWAERALKCGFPERFAQQALGHNSKAVHRAYAKHAEVTVPSLADWEKDWQENPQRSGQPKLLPVNFRSPLATVAQTN